jgi:multidrug efflux pump subunit AcrA (membrane-fusion protein)
VVPRTVEVIHQQSERVYVQGTLLDGDLVVADGTHRVVAGQGVRLAGSDGSGAQAR